MKASEKNTSKSYKIAELFPVRLLTIQINFSIQIKKDEWLSGKLINSKEGNPYHIRHIFYLGKERGFELYSSKDRYHIGEIANCPFILPKNY
jgi:hypothetical protein